MAINKSDLNRTRKLAIMVLKLKGVDPDQWLYQQYRQLIDENTDTIVELLGRVSNNPPTNELSAEQMEGSPGYE